MTLELRIPTDTGAKLREQAAAIGQDLESYILQAVAEKLAGADANLPARSSKEWGASLKACIDLHPVATHFVDDRRESIYAGRGE